MPTSIGIFNIYKQDEYILWRFLRKSFFSILGFMSNWNLMLSWGEHEKFYNLQRLKLCVQQVES